MGQDRTKDRTDVRIQDHGTIWQFTLLTPDAWQWADAHVPDMPAYLLTRGGFTADWRPGQDIMHGMIDAGLQVTVS